MPDLQVLRQADFVLSKCGRPMAPRGLSVVYLYRGIPVQTVLATASQQTIQREISGDTVFELRALSITTTSTTALYFIVTLPNGRNLINNLQDITQVAGYGSTRYIFSKPLDCPPGSKVTITFDDTIPNAGSAQPVMILLEGADKYFLRGGKLSPCVDDLVSSGPRYTQDVNQNILAPCWQQGYYPEPPANCVEEIFTYVSQVVTIAVTATNLSGTAQINIDRDLDFELRRLLVYVYADSTVTAGSFLGKVRLGGGYQLTDDFVDLARYLGSSPMPGKGLFVRRGDSIFVDLELVDQTGTGNINFQLFAEGLRRKAA